MADFTDEQLLADLQGRAALAQERRYREEADDIAQILTSWTGRTHAGRERGFGSFRGRFVVHSPPRPELAHGLFVRARSFPCLVRLSSFGAEPSHHVLAIKILDDQRDGEPVTLHDFVLESLATCPFAGIREYTPEAIAKLGSPGSDRLASAYYGLFPARLGPHLAMKFAARPRPRTPGGPVVFDFAIQVQADPEREPIEDASVEWQTDWVELAELVFDEASDPGIADASVFASPFQCLADHEPLGRLNRLRRHLYQDPGAKRRAFPFVPRSLRVCVVGAGAAGMAAADALSQRGHEVVLVERRAKPGGHAESEPHGPLATDPSFGSYTRATHPNLFALLERLGLESFELTKFNEGGSWRTADGRHAWTNTQDIPFARHVFEEILRFNRRDIPRVRADRSFDEVSAGEFLRQNGYSRDFLLYYFFGHVVYGFPGHAYAHYLAYPIRPLLNYLFDFTVHGAQALYSVTGGSGRYAQAYADALVATGKVDLRLSAQLRVLSRDPSGVVVDMGGAEERFDHLVLSVQPHHALALLGDAATREERLVLGGFSYTTDTVYLHTDPAHMPRDRALWRYLNIVVPDPSEQETATHFVATKLMPSNHDGETPVFMTFAHRPDFEPPEGATAITRDHPRLDVEAIRSRRLLAAIQGERRTWFCGAYTRGLALHDDALVSGFEAANRILGAGSAVPVIERAALLESEAAPVVEPDLLALEPVADEAPPRERIVAEILRVIHAVTRVEVSPDDRLVDKLATDSLGVIELSEALRRALRVNLPPSVFQPGVTARELARHVLAARDREAPASARGLVLLAAPARELPLFLAPPLLLDVEVFTMLARELGRDRPVFGLRNIGDHIDTEALVREQVQTIVAACPERCCFLGGYSHGGGVAHRVAELLTLEHGFVCPVVFMFDSFHATGFGEQELPADALEQGQMVELYLRSVAPSLPPDWEQADPQTRLRWATEAYARYGRGPADQAEFLAFLERRRQLLASQEAWQAQDDDDLALVLPELVYFRAASRDPSGSHAERWSERFVFATVHELEADHATILRHTDAIAEVMRELMRNTDADALAYEARPEPPMPADDDQAESLFELEATTLAGEPEPLDVHRGKVVLVVNVASGCTFTPQYEGLEQLYAEFEGRGFVVLGFPSNEFGGQEPGDAEAIRSFCTTHFGVSFPIFAKVETLGPWQSPVFRFLAAREGVPQWNFSKYLVGRDGRVLTSFPSTVRPEDAELRAAILAALSEPCST
ncbi:MAG: FAD-dependent oxidoreductase [Enhygromyxa sp.]